MGEQHCGKLYAHANIHTIGLGGNIQFLTDMLHPLAAASAYRYDTFPAVIRLVIAPYSVSPIFQALNMAYRGLEIEVHMLF